MRHDFRTPCYQNKIENTTDATPMRCDATRTLANRAEQHTEPNCAEQFCLFLPTRRAHHQAWRVEAKRWAYRVIGIAD